MNFIKKIFDKKVDDLTHIQFMKFSRGEFKNKAIVKAKNSSGKYTIYTTAEYANESIIFAGEKLGEKKAKVTGGIISTINLKEVPEYKTLLANCEVKQFQGVKNFKIDLEMTGKEIVHIVKAFPKAFFGLSFEAPEITLKIKAKAPKSAKPSSKDATETPNPDFCKIVTTNKEVVNSFVFEKTDFKEALINHTFLIEEVVIPDSLKNEKDFAKVREGALKVGKILRKAVIDGKEIKTEIPLRA